MHRILNLRILNPRIGSPRINCPRIGSPRIDNPRNGSPRISCPRIGSPRIYKVTIHGLGSRTSLDSGVPWVPGSTWAPWSFLFPWAPLAKKPDRTCSTKIEGRTLENEVYTKLAEKANEELEMELKEAVGEKMEL